MASMDNRHRIVCYGVAFADQLAALESQLGDSFAVDMVPPDLDPARMGERLADAVAVIAVNVPAGLPLARGLKLLQVPATGWDAVPPEHVPSTAAICNVGGHEIAVAEYCVAQMLAWRHRLRESEVDFRAGSWAWSGRYGGTPHAELHGATVGIVGYGGIGRCLAHLLRAFNVTVLVANRSKTTIGGPVAQAFGLDGIPEMMTRCDFGVVCLPLTPMTRGVVGREALTALGSSGVIVNVGRGPLVDESALYAALTGGSLGGAIIDVWYRYPEPFHPADAAPSHLDFTALPNVIMTPHISGWTDGTARRRVAAIAANIRRAAAGEKLTGLVAVGTRWD